MKPILFVLTFFLAFSSGLRAQPAAADSVELTRLLNEFLDGVSRGNVSVHERFWADDLIYTSSAGQRTDKPTILNNSRNSPESQVDDPVTKYSAEDIRIQQYGNTAIVAFKLVGTVESEGETEIMHFLNTGTFLKRDGIWQVVSWQATRIPDNIE